MENHSKRAVRRHHRDRLIAKRKKVIWWAEHTPHGMLANTPCRCSCWMCGNPRKYYKAQWIGRRTIQERKHYQESINERAEEINNEN